MSGEIDKLIVFYYDYIGEAYFLDALAKFSIGEGFGLEYVWCVFSHYYETWEDDYFGDEGVAFYFEPPAVKVEETIILNNNEFYRYLEEAAMRYTDKNSDSKKDIIKYLKKVKVYLNISH